MNERQRIWLIIAVFVLIFGLMSAVMQGGAGRRPPPAGQTGPADGAKYFQ